MKLVNYFYWILSFILFLFIKIISFFIKIRLKCLHSERIGHYVMEVCLYLHERKKNKKKREIHIFYNSNKVSNLYFYNLIRKKLFFIPWFLGFRINFFLNFFSFQKDDLRLSKYLDRDLDKLIYKNKTILKIPEKDLAEGFNNLKKMGIEKSKKFICLGIRDGQYLKDTFPSKSYKKHNYRDTKPENFIKLIEFLNSQGFYVIKMNKTSEKKLPIKNPLFIDYTESKFASESMDFFLSNQCEFFISTGYGFDCVPRIFKKPILIVSMAPLGYLPTYIGNSMLSFKKYFCKRRGKYLNLKEIFSENLAYIADTHELNTRDIILHDNTSEELLDIIKEFIIFRYKSKEYFRYVNLSKEFLKKLGQTT